LTRRTKKWLLGIGVAAVAMLIALSVTGYVLARRVEPFIREQVIAYLHDRFDSDVELAALRVRMPRASIVETLFRRGHGLIATVEGDGVQLRFKGRRDLPPIFAMKQFRFDVELRTLLDQTKVLHLVTIDGMEINIPPKGDRPNLASSTETTVAPPQSDPADTSNVLLEQVVITNAALTILPSDRKKFPLRFDVHRARLLSAGQHVAMKYEAALTNAKPRGEGRDQRHVWTLGGGRTWRHAPGRRLQLQQGRPRCLFRDRRYARLVRPVHGNAVIGERQG
jgi:hypothetical protein